MYNLVFQSNSFDFSWKCEEEADMPMSDWRQGEWARGAEGSPALFSKCSLENVSSFWEDRKGFCNPDSHIGCKGTTFKSLRNWIRQTLASQTFIQGLLCTKQLEY